MTTRKILVPIPRSIDLDQFMAELYNKTIPLETIFEYIITNGIEESNPVDALYPQDMIEYMTVEETERDNYLVTQLMYLCEPSFNSLVRPVTSCSVAYNHRCRTMVVTYS